MVAWYIGALILAGGVTLFLWARGEWRRMERLLEDTFSPWCGVDGASREDAEVRWLESIPVLPYDPEVLS